MLQFADGALEDGDLRDRIAGALQFFADLVLQVGRVADAVDEEIKKSFCRKETLCFELFNGFIAYRDIRAAQVKHYIVVPALPDAFEP